MDLPRPLADFKEPSLQRRGGGRRGKEKGKGRVRDESGREGGEWEGREVGTGPPIRLASPSSCYKYCSDLPCPLLSVL